MQNGRKLKNQFMVIRLQFKDMGLFRLDSSNLQLLCQPNILSKLLKPALAHPSPHLYFPTPALHCPNLPLPAPFPSLVKIFKFSNSQIHSFSPCALRMHDFCNIGAFSFFAWLMYGEGQYMTSYTHTRHTKRYCSAHTPNFQNYVISDSLCS